MPIGPINFDAGDSIKVKAERLPNGGENISITCGKCGEPITETHKWGMSCKNQCYKAECVQGLKELDTFIADFMKENGIEE